MPPPYSLATCPACLGHWAAGSCQAERIAMGRKKHPFLSKIGHPCQRNMRLNIHDSLGPDRADRERYSLM